MNGILKSARLMIACLLMALIPASIANAQSGGPKKQFSLSMSPKSVLAATGPITLTATIENRTPNGNSTFNSMVLALADGGGLKIDTTGTITLKYALKRDGALVNVDAGFAVAYNTAGAQRIEIQKLNPPIKPNWVLVVTFQAIPVTDCTAINANFSAQVYTGSQLDGDAFELLPAYSSVQVSGCDGIIACPSIGLDNQFPPAAEVNVGDIVGYRGENKDISACQRVAYDLVDNRDSTIQRSVEFRWDYTSQPAASFVYTVPWLPELADSTTGMPKPTKLAWLQNGVYTTPVNGRACISDTLPTCVGTLSAGINATQTSITVAGGTGCVVPTNTNVTPFAITIERERMLVTAITTTTAPYTWTVVRGDGQTAAIGHDLGSKIATNPLPLDAGGKQMQMCIKEESFKVSFPGAEFCSGSSGPICSVIEVTTTVFDIGDGLMIR